MKLGDKLKPVLLATRNEGNGDPSPCSLEIWRDPSMGQISKNALPLTPNPSCSKLKVEMRGR